MKSWYVLLLVGVGACSEAVGGAGIVPPAVPAPLWEALAAAEDARGATPEQLDLLRSSLGSEIPAVRAQAARALGRMQLSAAVADVAPLLDDPAETVRWSAAHALGDIARDSATAAVVRPWLVGKLAEGTVTDSTAGALAESLGRVPTTADDAAATAGLLSSLFERGGEARVGAVRGLYFLSLKPEGRQAVTRAIEPLERTAVHGTDPHERALAFAVLANVRAIREERVGAGRADTSAQVRRAAAAAAAAIEDTAGARRVTSANLVDEEAAVRLAALSVWGGRLAAQYGCEPVVRAVHDPAVHVSLLAIEQLGTVCRDTAHVALLDSIAAAATPELHGWHQASRAVASLAAIDAARAAPRIPALARHPVEFARARAAGAAQIAGDAALLRLLAADPRPNVRTAAVRGLSALVGAAADDVYLAQLPIDEPEILMEAAGALAGSSTPGVVDSLLAALDRVTALRRETTRDARVALLTRIGELGGSAQAGRVQPYLADFDVRAAELAADILGAWTGTRPTPIPRPLPRQPMPTFAELEELAGRKFVVVLDDSAEVEIETFPFDAPTNAWRFARLARAGYFDGLTLHRVVPNFVVQGGSPGGNEFNGDGPYTRDEVGLRNLRGMVGLSTRGRDTGDGQLYINLIDNVRLDHDYTVWGVVTRGMEVVDRMLEGATILEIREEPVS